MMPIIITAIITFIITVLWSSYSKKKGYQPLYANFTLLLKELENLTKASGHKDLYNYWIRTKGKDYADTAMTNVKHTLDFLKDK